MSSPTLHSEVLRPIAPASRKRNLFHRWNQRHSPRTRPLVDRFLFGACFTDPEYGRRARLVTWFGFLGFLFGMLYAAFYLGIHHLWGAAIVTVCSLGFLATPYLMRALRSVTFGGHFLAALMTLGFTALCYVEGGLRGHAVAWLASVPLCALLLVGKKAAGVWVLISFAAAASVMAADLAGLRLPVLYDPAWRPLVDSAGYLGLIIFMFGLGLIFEVGREQAFGKMTDALASADAANERLRIVSAEKTEFMGVAAHDLRNPLTIIITYAEMLRDGHGKDPKSFASAIYTAGTRMRDLITSLLDANAIEEGRFSCEIERCELAPLITASVEQNKINATRKKTEIVVAPGPPLWARTDRSVTVQILDNLISNALKYAPPQSRVVIQPGRENGSVFVAIKDEGPGISEADQAKLFGRYARLTARPTGGESSTGLGLSIVKRLVAAMHGAIECQSTLGAGSTFTVRLPAWEDTTAD